MTMGAKHAWGGGGVLLRILSGAQTTKCLFLHPFSDLLQRQITSSLLTLETQQEDF